MDHDWLLRTTQAGYTGTSYLQVLPDSSTLYQTGEITTGPRVDYPIYVTTPSTYTVWLRGYPTNSAGDSTYLTLGDQTVDVTGFAPGEWHWANTMTAGVTATLTITTTGVQTVSLWMREDGLRIDRLLLTTATTFIPAGEGPLETERQLSAGGLILPLTRTIVYTYDNLYRLTDADYSTHSAGSGQAGELYQYAYDPVGNRLQQIINGDTTDYLYDDANRLEQVSHQSSVNSYQFDANGNLLTTGAMTNTWDAANRLDSSAVSGQPSAVDFVYNGIGDRVGQTVGLTTTYFALDVAGGLPEVIYTNNDEAYLHLPGVIVAESSSGEIRYLLSDGLGSVRQAVDDTGQVMAYYEFDPYGNPVNNDGGEPYGYTGEWYEGYIGLLHLRARWYSPGIGTFLSRDAVESEPPYAYVRGNPVNWTDPGGMAPPPPEPQGTPTPGPTATPPVQPPPAPAPLAPYPVSTPCSDPLLFSASGYAEGYTSILSVGIAVASIDGNEVVYDFATLERATYQFEDAPLADPNYVPYLPGGTTPEWGFTNMTYYVDLHGFDSSKSLDQEYAGYFYSVSGGIGLSKSVFKKLSVSASIGAVTVLSPEVTGSGGYIATGDGVSLLPLSLSVSKTKYKAIEKYRYVPKGMNAREEHIEQMKIDIQSGLDSPGGTARPYSRWGAINRLDEVWRAHEYYFTSKYNGYQPPRNER